MTKIISIGGIPTEITGSGFNGITTLKRFEFQNNEKTILNSNSMQNLANLEEIIFPCYLDFIWSLCFINAGKMTILDISGVERRIDFNCFKWCSWLTTVHFRRYNQQWRDLLYHFGWFSFPSKNAVKMWINTGKTAWYRHKGIT